MRKITFFLLLFLAGTVLAGCTAQKLIERGDASMLANRPDEAARLYRAALEHDSDLAKKADFVAKFKRARSQAAYGQGQALADQGLWEQAVDKFSETLDIDPESDNAKSSLARAKKEASRQRHSRALKYADQGKLNQAIIELKRALELDPDNLDARDAIESVSDAKKDRQSRARSLHESGLAFQEQKRWLKSSETLQAAVELDPNRLPIRVSLHRSEEVLRGARAKYGAGSSLMKEGKLDEAIATFEESLDIWPFFDEASGSLTRVQAMRNEAERLYENAVNFTKQRRWDDAIGQAEAARKIYPFHRPAGAVLAEAKHSAANEHCQAGDRLLAKKDLLEAEKEFQRSLDYVPDMVPAREGLARIDDIRGTADQQKGLWGSALLWYTEANNHIPKMEYINKIGLAKGRVLARISFGIGVNVTDARAGGVTAESSALRSHVFSGVSSGKPQFLRLESENNAAKPPSYTVAVSLEDLSIRGGLLRSENRTHQYTVYRDVPNPEIARLDILLQVERRDLDRLIRDSNRPCHTCRGSGVVRCDRCRGSGKVKGHTCARCQGTGKVKCQRCHGHGRATRVSGRDIESKRRLVRDLQNRLFREPVTVRRAFPAEWQYVVNYYDKSGAIRTRIRITSSTAGAKPEAITVQKTFRREDSTISNANPGIGLGADPLDLPSDDAVRSALVQAAGSEASGRIVAAVLKARAGEVRAKAEASSRAGDSINAFEAYVDLAHIMAPYDPVESARLIGKLRLRE
ncbi:MAG: tetratricopeptide repeat protein [Planctomycetota bacterium]|nr:tetratricopeptide repeat protein [Planctomycetota bacterium]